ncbi:nitrite reductase small subunit NirD [Gordonia sp. Z-3]|jgi:nitrite reductase (NADH) small subunit|uniref:Nitrite reductase small subunit NirD n=2 Tax=Gordonia TaxID=2053 RepID=A0A9X3I691_9ACTN|nr:MULTISPECIES: nitrite reductase small subunit NirD [Gordonia]MAU84745.1 nitrite reductase (NAD(P)H) small subunit [Gordonia sp. (in: high G+C Gram-positive bacteria)]MCF3939874.1 nitrite reductase small subunit NirD [Gordonia tangerina]MCX2965279.1 nitrite reductase small subunit NirD [Gordonia aquimaris]MED5799709.1 nitrite reductase small subunit NirD [Gordonia sp. Z-3]
MTVAARSTANQPADPTTHAEAVPGQWIRACALADLAIGRGAGVLGPDFEQAALFRIPAVETDREAVVGRTRLYAIGNIDPFARAAVLSRGVTGDRGGEPTVASPLGKQVFSLRSGICLDDEAMSVPSYAVRVVDDIVEVYFQRR